MLVKGRTQAADILGNNTDASKERPIVLEGSDDSEKKKPMQKKEKFIDLSDVPPKLPIKSSRKSGSKYQGVYFDKLYNKWRARIKIDGKKHHIGTFDTEEEAGIDYARAAYKYKYSIAEHRAYGIMSDKGREELTCKWREIKHYEGNAVDIGRHDDDASKKLSRVECASSIGRRGRHVVLKGVRGRLSRVGLCDS